MLFRFINRQILNYQLHQNTSHIHPYMHEYVWESDALRAKSPASKRSEITMASKRKKGSANSAPRVYARRAHQARA